MALRNAFEEMATEDTLAALVEVLGELKRLLAPPARDANDRLRVVTDTASTSLAYLYSSYYGHAATYPLWYATGLLNSMDPREVQAQQSVANFNQVRQQRWVTA